MRRVAHVLRKLDQHEWGGTETHVTEVVKRLDAFGWRAEVHAPRAHGSSEEHFVPGIPLLRYRSFLPVVGPSSRRRALRANAGNIVSLDEPLRLMGDSTLSLVHLHTGGRVGGGVRAAMRVTNRPYVISVHGPLIADGEWLRRDVERRRRWTVDVGQPLGLLLGSRHVIDDAARVVVFNEAERQALLPRLGRRVVRMDHGVDSAHLASGSPARAKVRWPELSAGPVVCVVGRLCEQKNQMLAVRAFAEAAPADHHLALAGAATDRGYRDRVEEEARRLGVAARVHLLGNIDAATEVPNLYALSRLVLVPSSYESFGLVVLEGWAAGRPVLFARHSGLADIAAGCSEPLAVTEGTTVEEWKSAIARYLADEGLAEANRRAGMALVKRRYDWDVVARDVGELYDDVVDEFVRRGRVA